MKRIASTDYRASATRWRHSATLDELSIALPESPATASVGIASTCQHQGIAQ